MPVTHMQNEEWDDKIIIHAHLYSPEGGSWHSSKRIIKRQWEE
jgi:hypothetical protein